AFDVHLDVIDALEAELANDPVDRACGKGLVSEPGDRLAGTAAGSHATGVHGEPELAVLVMDGGRNLDADAGMMRERVARVGRDVPIAERVHVDEPAAALERGQEIGDLAAAVDAA